MVRSLWQAIRSTRGKRAGSGIETPAAVLSLGYLDLEAWMGSNRRSYASFHQGKTSYTIPFTEAPPP